MFLRNTLLCLFAGIVAAQDLAGCPSNAVKTGTGFDVNFYGYPILNEAGWKIDWFDHVGYREVGSLLHSVSGVTDIFYETPSYFTWNVGEVESSKVYGYEITTTNFSMELTGWFQSSQSGEHTFNIHGDDGAYLQLGRGNSCCGNFDTDIVAYDVVAFDNWARTDLGPTYTVNLTADLLYPIRIITYNYGNYGTLRMNVTYPDGTLSSDFDNVYQIKHDEDSGYCPVFLTSTTTGAHGTETTKTLVSGSSTEVEVITWTPVLPITTTTFAGSESTTFTSVGAATTYPLEVNGTTSFTTMSQTTVYVETPTDNTAITTTEPWSGVEITTLTETGPYTDSRGLTGVITSVIVQTPTAATAVTTTESWSGAEKTTLTETGPYTDPRGVTSIIMLESWVPHGTFLYTDPKYWIYFNQFDATDNSLAARNATLPSTWPQKCLGGLSCIRPNGSLVIVDPSTKFLSHCFLSTLGFIWALIFVVPIVAKIRELTLFHGNGKATVAGQIATLAAVWAPVLGVLQTFPNNTTIVPVDFVLMTITLIAAVLHRIQDGRVAVCSQELLCFWMVESFVYVALAINDFLINGLEKSWLQALSAFCAVLAFVCEVWNTERHPKYEYDDFSVFSKCFLNFVNPVLTKCKIGKQISQSDFPKVPADCEASACARKFKEVLNSHLGDFNHRNAEVTEAEGRFKLVSAIFSLVGRNLLFSVVFTTLHVVCDLYAPFALAKFLTALAEYQIGSAELYRAYYTALQFAIVPLARISFETLASIQTTFARTKTRGSLLMTLYNKATNLSPKSREEFEASKVMNLINVDAGNVISVVEMSGVLVAMPIMLVISMNQLWKLLGYSFFVALLIYVLVMPAQALVSSKVATIFPAYMQLIDKRSKTISNILRSIKSLKLYAWEIPYLKRVASVRSEELSSLRELQKVQVISRALMNSISDYVLLAIFTLFLYLKQGTLSAELVFPVLLLLQLLSLSLVALPIGIIFSIQGLTSSGRLYQFLAQKENLRENYQHSSEGTVWEDWAIRACGVTASWNGETTENKTALTNISFEAHRGDFVCIVGRVGSGKTALLRTLCGELSILDGNVALKGSMAYSGQEAWLQNMTIQENVLFGQVLDQEWYDQVIDACELVRDIEDMPNKHDTEVGERGISLSGGQKARVALARAVYSRSDIVLLDDILSAVDEHVSKALISKLFDVNGLLANRTVLLATNNIKVLSHSSRIIALADKQVAEVLSFDEVLQMGESSLIYKLVKEFGGNLSVSGVNRRDASKRRTGLRATTSEDPAKFKRFDVLAGNSDEEEEKTASSLQPFLRYYFRTGRPWVTWLGLLLTILVISCRTSVIAYLGVLAKHEFTDLYTARWYFSAYFAITLGVTICLFYEGYIMQMILGIEKSQILHDKMVWSVMRAPMAFFDKTPFGRLLNRFTGDFTQIDQRFADSAQDVISTSLNVIISLVPVLLGSPQVILIVVPLGWWANLSRQMYVPAQRKVTRINSAANSPLLSHIEESLKGQSIVRSFGQSERFEEMFLNYVNHWSSTAFFRNALSGWITVQVGRISVVLGVSAAFGVTQLIGWHIVGASYGGVVLSFAQRMGTMIGGTVTAISSAEVSGVALERILEYVDLPEEASYHIEATEPAPAWPSKGEIVFNNLCARYTADSPLVLKNLSLNINSGEKIGVVGRTGSGKSTLTLTIFRLLEACEGDIEMDKVDTSILGLGDMRSRLSIVPQDAQIFNATVRDNLDPLQTVDDARLWEVLDLCHLKANFERLDGLDTELTGGGSQLSRGEAQLLCLGRALVRKAKVLVLDEATASVDHKTDQIIQDTIRKHMSDRTIITVAHRLNTIMDSDRVIVLERGEVKEFDTPQRLLEAKGLFYSLNNTEPNEMDKEDPEALAQS